VIGYNPAMFKLSREIRFAVNPGHPTGDQPTNGGFPSMSGFGHYHEIQITLAGELHSDTAYLRNIKEIDAVVRADGIPIVRHAIETAAPPSRVPAALFDRLRDRWPGAALESVRLLLTPFLSVSCFAKELPMVRLSQKFEFSAAHRLHNPALTDADNRKVFGKCNNALGHGHNYELQVTLIGEPDSNGVLIDIPQFESIVAEAVLDRFDHQFLNLETEEFRELIPSVENIAMVIYRLLKPKFTSNTRLASVTVWETPKTWCEYSE